jgi:hypothetical protein
MRVLSLLPNEQVLWEAQPHWAVVAREVFHIRLIMLYFALLFIVDSGLDRWNGLSPLQTLTTEAPLAELAAGVCVLVGLVAWWNARCTAYAITDRRVVIRWGVAFPATLSLPLRVIASVAVRVHPDQSGEMPLQLRPGEKVSFLKLWPMVRPWHLRQAQPMLRAVPQAGPMAAMLSRTLAAAQAAAQRDLAPPPRPVREAVEYAL